MLAPSCQVRVVGLVGRSELNGRLATALRYVPGRGRWEVRLDGEASSAMRLGLKPEHLERIASTTGDDCAVCLNSLDTSEPTQTLTCSHRFHADCIKALRRHGAMELCPLCRKPSSSLRSVQSFLDDACALFVQHARLSPESEAARAVLSVSVRALEEAVAIDPCNATVQNNLGYALSRTGDAAGERSAYRAAIASSPTAPLPLCNLAQCLLGQDTLWENMFAYESGHSKDNVDEAISLLQRAIAADPRFVQAHVALGRAFMEAGNREGSLAALQAALEVDPNHIEANVELGTTLDFDDMDGAIAHFRRAIRADPHRRSPHSERAREELEMLLPVARASGKSKEC
ncbi:unnamed protein product [Prorocentrum cordatum]|uniref:RING-type domain-containing protein n=1 Tax=Prorocentrum cordatum TaxID=2364126 RepID=A0ABN9XTF9_9DINO|nr:unnamed protein product [Polarella glacialis]